MTKKEIETIQRREYDLMCELDLYEKEFGMDNPATNLMRAKWNGVYNLMKTLGIETKCYY